MNLVKVLLQVLSLLIGQRTLVIFHVVITRSRFPVHLSRTVTVFLGVTAFTALFYRT